MIKVGMTPCHPGDFVRTEVLEPLGLSVTAAARVLGVSRVGLSNLLNSRADLSAEMAIRLEKAFDLDAATMMRMQAWHSLDRAQKHSSQIHVRRYKAA